VRRVRATPGYGLECPRGTIHGPGIAHSAADTHEANDFNFHPIREVAILFAGIFATMMPALDWLQTSASQLGHPTPALFFFGTGALSSVLDKAPAYLSFLSAAFSMTGAVALIGTGLALVASRCIGLSQNNSRAPPGTRLWVSSILRRRSSQGPEAAARPGHGAGLTATGR